MRNIINLNDGWSFTKQNVGLDGLGSAEKIAINVPHTWNNLDGQDGGNDYYRGTCWYEKTFAKPQTEGKVFIEFKGVNASAQVFVNGKQVASHDGGYSTFRADITDVLVDGDNALVVSVDNSVRDDVYPQTADFTFWGGIYRDVNLICVPEQHFDLLYYGAKGIKITPTVKDGVGEVEVVAYTNDGEVQITIKDADGQVVASGKNGETFTVENVNLWDGVTSPYLYTATATLVVDGEVKDEIADDFGFRTFYVDPKRGFFLNGRLYPLRGVCRHQDRKNMGNAITKKEHEEDMQIIQEIGANTLRLAHYQHDDYFYDLCDRAGIVVWAEIPYISKHMPNAKENAVSQMKELIYQQYNHPSIVTWGVSNEITMFANDKQERLEEHKRLDDLCHQLDPTRVTTLACYAACGPFNKIAFTTDIVSWNLYLGWYAPGLFLNDLWFDFFHLCHPKTAIGLSEYGAEAMTTLHSAKPKRCDNTEEYQAIYHEYMLKFISKRPWLWATHVWNMFDFAADARNQGGEPGMNHKGLVTFDRKIKKDAFYIYKAYWSETPFVHICGQRFVNRTGNKMPVKVYSNLPEVKLFVNGVEYKGKKKGKHIFNFNVPLTENTLVKAVAGDCTDECTFHKVDKPDDNYKLQVASNNYSWQI